MFQFFFAKILWDSKSVGRIGSGDDVVKVGKR
jgi:hypothetical protein